MKTLPVRKSSPRLKGYDYSQPGAYFITICTYHREFLFGEIVAGKMHLNQLGEMIKCCWQNLINYYGNLALDDFAIMPNHIHAILTLEEPIMQGVEMDDDPLREQFQKKHLAGTNTSNPSLSQILARFKSVSTIQGNKLRHTPGKPIWQRSFYDRILRNETEWGQAHEYIINNPLQWESDSENPCAGI